MPLDLVPLHRDAKGSARWLDTVVDRIQDYSRRFEGDADALAGAMLRLLDDDAFLAAWRSIAFQTGGLGRLPLPSERTAQDVARLIHFAMQKNEIRESVLQPSYSFRILNNNKFRKINNTDILLGSFLNDKKHGYELIGGKTGYLFEAGYCLGVEIENNHRAVVIVVLDSPNIGQRFQDVKVIADWVYSNYAWQ